MSETDPFLEKLVESEVESLIQDDSYYQVFATPLKPAKMFKQQHRRQLIEFFKLPKVNSQLNIAQSLILNLLPDSISPEEFAKVKDEVDKSGEHFLHFIEQQSNTPEAPATPDTPEKPILFQEMVGISDTTLLHVYDLAKNLIEKGKTEDASALFVFLTTLAPHVPSYWIALGVCYQDLNWHEDAIAAFGAAKFLNPENPAPSFYTVESYNTLRDTEKAKFELEELNNIIKNLGNEEKEQWNKKIESILSF